MAATYPSSKKPNLQPRPTLKTPALRVSHQSTSTRSNLVGTKLHELGFAMKNAWQKFQNSSPKRWCDLDVPWSEKKSPQTDPSEVKAIEIQRNPWLTGQEIILHSLITIHTLYRLGLLSDFLDSLGPKVDLVPRVFSVAPVVQDVFFQNQQYQLVDRRIWAMSSMMDYFTLLFTNMHFYTIHLCNSTYTLEYMHRYISYTETRIYGYMYIYTYNHYLL